MNDLKPRIVETIIDNLYDRGGFDDWWYSIDEKTQDEIRVELIQSLPDELYTEKDIDNAYNKGFLDGVNEYSF